MADYSWSFPDLSPDDYFRGINVATLPAGMRNNNIGNIKYSNWSAKLPGAVGTSRNLDQGDPQVVFNSPEAGVAATARLALNKYTGGMTNLNSIIAGDKGWTPGNYDAAANIARSMGIKPTDNLNLSDPAAMTKFVRGLALQEHGPSSGKFTDATINTGINGVFGGNAATTSTAAVPAGTGNTTPPLLAQAGMQPQLAAANAASSASAPAAQPAKDFNFAGLSSSGLGLMAAGAPHQTWTPSNTPPPTHQAQATNLMGILAQPSLQQDDMKRRMMMGLLG